jgi:hypothetical protein
LYKFIIFSRATRNDTYTSEIRRSFPTSEEVSREEREFGTTAGEQKRREPIGMRNSTIWALKS